jgi:hypothetical protein
MKRIWISREEAEEIYPTKEQIPEYLESLEKVNKNKYNCPEAKQQLLDIINAKYKFHKDGTTEERNKD